MEKNGSKLHVLTVKHFHGMTALDFAMYYPIHSYRFVSSFNKCISVRCNARTIGKFSYQTQQPVLDRKHLQFRGGVQNSERHLLVHAIADSALTHITSSVMNSGAPQEITNVTMVCSCKIIYYQGE
jgi:hypothetical protein